jgi:flagellar biosynthesis chaperone FliJ
MSVTDFREKLKRISGEFSIKEVINYIEKLIKEDSNKKRKEYWDELFWEKFKIHPLIRKAIDWGGQVKLSKKLDSFKKIQEKINEISKKGGRGIEAEDIEEIKNLLEVLKNDVLNSIAERYGDVEQGLRHLHAPGNVAKSEGINLYYSKESYTKDTLYKMASRLCDSITLGDDIGVYTDDEDLMEKLRELVKETFNESFRIDLNKVNIDKDETSYPYITFLKFILYLKKIELTTKEESIKILLQKILEGLKRSPIYLFFMPGGEGERWATIILPRLDLFIEKWVEKDELRERLDNLNDNISTFIQLARKKKEKKIENYIDLLRNNYEILCYNLIAYGIPEYYSMRNILDIMLEISLIYDIKLYAKAITLSA